MARLANRRDTYLERAEIAAAALRLFDAGAEVSIRQLAGELRVTPAAIYHHFESRDEIVKAAVGLVWEEAFANFGGAVDPYEPPTDTYEFLVSGALATRRAFSRHYQVARFISAPPTPDTRLAGGLAILGSLFEDLGLDGEHAGEALFAYATYTIGSILLSASRRHDSELAGHVPGNGSFSSVDARPADAPASAPETGAAVDRAVSVTGSASDVEEAYFLAGLRALLTGLLENTQREPA